MAHCTLCIGVRGLETRAETKEMNEKMVNTEIQVPRENIVLIPDSAVLLVDSVEAPVALVSMKVVAEMVKGPETVVEPDIDPGTAVEA